MTSKSDLPKVRVDTVTRPPQRIHELKTWPGYFGGILDRTKRFEVRKNDRHFEAGDVLHLREWRADVAFEDGADGAYTGREAWRRVVYILLRHPGLKKGYVVMGLEEMEGPPND